MTEKRRQFWWGVGGSVALHALALLLLTLMAAVARHRRPPEVLVVDLVAYAPPPVADPVPVKPLPTTPPATKVEPPSPMPAPKEEPPVVVPTQKEASAAKPKKPTLQERLEAARKQQPKKVETPQSPQRSPQQSDALRRLQEMERRLQTTQQTPTRASAIPNVPAAQMSRYEAYNQRCVMPALDREWQRLGPNGLERPPNDAVVTFSVAPDGRVTGCFVSQESESAAMNRAAEALCRELTQRRLPAFSTVNLMTERGAALVFTYHLRYARR